METDPARGIPGPIREAFLADHRRLEALVDQLLAACEADDRAAIAKLWRQVESGLLAHFEAEESHLIPELVRRSERDARVIIGEHQHLRARLAELGVGVDLHLVRLEAARHFVDELRAHARNEDRLLYCWADDRLDDAARVATIGALPDRAPVLRVPS